MSWIIGQGRGDITVYVPGMVMLGFGSPKNTVKGLDETLNARTLWFSSSDSDKFLIFTNLEICFVTQSLTDGVMEKLKTALPEVEIKRKNIIFTAQHTHASPSSYTHYTIYNLPNGGFSQQVLDKLIEGCVESIVKAYQSRRPSTVEFKRGRFPDHVDIGFNRAIKSYNRNTDVSPKLHKSQDHLAIDREMPILEIKDELGTSAVINWFGIHPTILSQKNHILSPEHKGYASLDTEKYFNKKHNRKDFCGIFAQGTCGDVSPNRHPFWGHHLIPHNQSKMLIDSKKHGKLQSTWLINFLEEKGRECNDQIDSELIYVDFSKVKIPNRYLPDHLKDKGVRTSGACLGVGFLQGSRQSGTPIPYAIMLKLLSFIIKVYEFLMSPFFSEERKTQIKEKYKAQWPKSIVVETGDKRVMGTTKVKDLILPGFLDTTFGNFKKFAKRGGVKEHSWTQQVLPIQLAILGDVAIAAIPSEVTTVSGRRLRSELLSILSKRGIKDVITSPYANSYCGYISTPEEYDLQGYEGGHTVFGKWTLPAFQSQFSILAHEMIKPESERNLDYETLPPQFSKEELSKRSLDLKSLRA